MHGYDVILNLKLCKNEVKPRSFVQFENVSDSVPSSLDTREHFDCNIANLTSTVINCSVSSGCNDCTALTTEGMSPTLSQVVSQI